MANYFGQWALCFDLKENMHIFKWNTIDFSVQTCQKGKLPQVVKMSLDQLSGQNH